MPSRRHSSAIECSPRKHDADLIFRGVTLPRCPADALDDLFGRQVSGVGFLSHLRSLAATMSQKSSLPQAAKSVSRVLVSDILASCSRAASTAYGIAYRPAMAVQAPSNSSR